jgi:hypothetical protein
MRASNFVSSLAIALLPTAAVADWAGLKDTTTLGSCGTRSGSLMPVFENDAFDDICDKLVKDGCVRPPSIIIIQN